MAVCPKCGDDIGGQPGVVIEAKAFVNAPAIDAIVAPGIDGEHSDMAEFCGECVVEAAPDINVSVDIT